MAKVGDGDPQDQVETQDPTEEVGPDHCDAGPEHCELRPGELDGAPQDCEYPHHAEVEDGFPVEEIPLVMDEDGMPRPVDPPGQLPLAHPFTYETMTCIADDREYVELFEEEFPGTRVYLYRKKSFNFRDRICFAAGGVSADEQLVFTARRRYDDDGIERTRLTFEPKEVVQRGGIRCVIQKDELWPVRPRRECCKFYRRQVFAHDGTLPGDKGHKLVFRNCMMRRSIGGAFMSVSNEAVYACDYRDPPDPDAVKEHLDDFDQDKLETRPDLKHVPAFGLEGEEIHYDDKGEVK